MASRLFDVLFDPVLDVGFNAVGVGSARSGGIAAVGASVGILVLEVVLARFTPRGL